MRWKQTPVGNAPVIATALRFGDRAGSWKARWGIGRMSFVVPPGLYAIGDPTQDDPVVVTCNYKMSYDIVRSSLSGRNVWLLVLETYGINVWCAAGKGTFGTGELVRRIQSCGLSEVVSHRLLVLPLLGAAGVRAIEVRNRTGFTVRYATVRAKDLPEFLENGMSATPPMRELSFGFIERLILTPVEVVAALRGSPLIIILLLVMEGLTGKQVGLTSVAGYIGAVMAGSFVAPLLLPWLPTRSFAVKGAFAGLIWACLWYEVSGKTWSGYAIVLNFLLLPVVASFLTLNFTGSTPFTSRSGVKKEMRLALPVMAVALVAGALVWIAGLF